MKNKIIPTLALTLLLGCCGYTIPIAGASWSGPTNPQPGQDRSVQIVWNQTFGAALGSDVPPILWHFNDSCTDKNGHHGPKWGTPGSFMSAHSDYCEDGQYEDSAWVEATEFDATNRIDIEWHGTISDNQTFAHELCHAFTLYTNNDSDQDHKGPCFNSDTPYKNNVASPGSMVDIATKALIDVNL